jgi:hypothetical protein
MGEMRNAYNIFIAKSEGKRPLGRPKRRWEGNTGLNVKGGRIGTCGLDACGSG